MPRQTRAAARAQEADAEISIATDATATEGPSIEELQAGETKDRPVLVELTSNAVHEIEQAMAAADDEACKPQLEDGVDAKKGRGRGTAKRGGKSKKREQATREQQQPENNDKGAMNQAVSISQHDATDEVAAGQDAHAIASESGSEEHGDEVFQNSVEEGSNSPIAMTLSSEDARRADEKPQTGASPLPPPQSEAAQKLQSIFEKPMDAEDISTINLDEAVQKPLPVSPVKATPKPAQGNAASTTPKRASVSTRGKPPATNLRRTMSSARAINTSETGKTPANKGPLHSRDSSAIVKPSAVTRTSSGLGNETPKDDGKQEETDSSNKPRPRSSIAALHTPPRIAKSSKPATKPTFSLPSDALKDKLKAQKEERQKRQDEIAARMAEHKEKSGVTIQPTRKPSTETKRSASALTRSSLAGRKSEPSTARIANKPKLAVTDAQQRATSLVQRTRPSKSAALNGTNPKTHARKASTLVVRENKAATLRRTGSVSTATVTRPRPSNSKPIQPKPAAKPEPRIIADKDVKPFDRGAAAKKARAEAAERGRAASKEWAEKKRREVQVKTIAAQVEAVVEAKENIPPRVTTDEGVVLVV